MQLLSLKSKHRCHPERNRKWSEGSASSSVQHRREAPLNQKPQI
jgi:hypothetical protein